MDIIENEIIELKFAELSDRNKIYDMLATSDTSISMFDENHLPPTFDEFCCEDATFYTGKANKHGSYLLILHKNEVIGSISYVNEFDKIPYSELDIWIKSNAYTGKGIGVNAIKLLTEFIHNQFKISDFIIRPWIKNTYAIKAYKKCGFSEITNEALHNYYSDEQYNEYGEGDYGLIETLNLHMKL